MKEQNFEDEEANVYNDNAREELIDDDEITPLEEGFMKGYNEVEGYCAQCGSLIEPGEGIEREIDGKKHLFCSDECADTYEE